MKKTISLCLYSLLMAFSTAIPVGAAPKAQDVPVVVSGAWTKVTIPGSDVSAAYMRIEAKAPVKLLQAQSNVADRVELHDMRMTNGVMMMNPAGVVDIEPGKPVELKPGGLHVMLSKVKQPIVAGQPVLIRLTFVGKDNKPFTTSVDARAR
jgi:copper(I)-binding protein